MKLRSSTKIALGFALLVAAGTVGYQFVTDQMIMNQKFAALTPGRVNIVGVDPGSGYRIIVANQIAQLVETGGGFGGTESAEGGATEGAIKKRLPMRELIQSLQGNTTALGLFVMAVNDMKEDDTWPPERVIWPEVKLKKALAGDPAAEAELVRDLNMKLDGTPLTGLRFKSFENGIITEIDVPVKVNTAGGQKVLMAKVLEPFRPRLMKAIEADSKDKAVTREWQLGNYTERAREQLKNPTLRENLRSTLNQRISPTRKAELALDPERLLASATVVLTDNMIESARYVKVEGSDGKDRFNLTIDLNDEGRRRLWQFSKNRIGNQLLLVADGIAIAAPRIQHQLAQSELTIYQMPDEVLVRDAVEMLNRKENR